jgi:hypothetical protein
MMERMTVAMLRVAGACAGTLLSLDERAGGSADAEGRQAPQTPRP